MQCKAITCDNTKMTSEAGLYPYNILLLPPCDTQIMVTNVAAAPSTCTKTVQVWTFLVLKQRVCSFCSCVLLFKKHLPMHNPNKKSTK
jgi:hypothetical protein